jgi:hypothetical protein
MIWPEVYLNSLNHSSLEKKYNTWAITYPFPDYYGKEVDTHYVGEIFDENNNPVKS